jgi:hypothetical protein
MCVDFNASHWLRSLYTTGRSDAASPFGSLSSQKIEVKDCSCVVVVLFSRGPSIGSKGRVLMVVEDNPNKVGIRFDKPVYGGNNLVDLCEDGHGFFCNGKSCHPPPFALSLLSHDLNFGCLLHFEVTCCLLVSMLISRPCKFFVAIILLLMICQ